MNTSEKTWLFITRAQPGLHYGHLDGMQQGEERGITKRIVGIGSANKEYTAENPLTFAERKKAIEITSKALCNSMNTEIYPVPDFWDNEKRCNYLLKELPHFEYVVTGNPRVAEIMKKAWKEIIPLEVRKVVKWSTIRELLARRETKSLTEYMSQDLIDYLEKIQVPERLQDIFKKERRGPCNTVDVVLFDKQGKLILIERGNEPFGVALPGGFVDIGETLVTAAKREANEELNVEVEINKKSDYLWFWDEPDRDPRGHNIAHAFKAKILSWTPKAGDDAKEIVKVGPDQIDTLDFAFPDHKEMILEALSRRE